MTATAVDAEKAERARLKALLSSRDWRLRNLYWITDKWGKVSRFVPHAVQQLFLAGFHHRNTVLQRRQHGITTPAATLAMATALLTRHTTSDLVRHQKERVKAARVGKRD